MLIEIRKVGFVNKGAELMLYAVLKELRERYPSAGFAMQPNYGKAPFWKRAELGLYQKAPGWHRSPLLNLSGLLDREKLRALYGIVFDKQIDVVIDAAGFSYSDQWGSASSRELASSCKKWKKRGTKVLLLPQAFGPFKSTEIRNSIKEVVENANLIFARDSVSYNYLTEVVGERSNVKMAPDFTNLISGIMPADFDPDKNQICIVPNCRMIDKSAKGDGSVYIPFLIRCIKHLMNHGAKPFLLVHEGDADAKLAFEISAAFLGGVPIVMETHPLKIKGILGACKATIGSRFHGLVSALSQGVPSLATGWSHKYEMMFNDYGFGQGLLDVKCSSGELEEKMFLLLDDSTRNEISRGLKNHSLREVQKSRAMWSQVFRCIED